MSPQKNKNKTKQKNNKQQTTNKPLQGQKVTTPCSVLLLGKEKQTVTKTNK